MRFASTLTVIWFVMAFDAAVATAKLEIIISTPVYGSHVIERPYVAGTVTDPNASLWVVVHPMDVSDYWVQPAVTVRRDGSWKVQIYIGRSGNVDVGKRFEIRAVANPKVRLREGLVLPGWPQAGVISDVVEVERR
jgi:hypothetical protein